MAAAHTFTATCSRGMEPVLASELRRIGLNRVKEERSAVRFMGKLADGYRACLWSRTASRVLLRLNRFQCEDADALYEGIWQTDWSEHLAPHTTFAIDFVGGSRTIRHNQFGSRRAKDAIADQLMQRFGRRPDVNVRRPDIPLHVHLSHAVCTVSLDLCGFGLHQRGHGRGSGEAPLRETLAASLLELAGWPKAAREGRPLYDPMCGSGTFLMEAAGMGLDRAPALGPRRWAFTRWPQHDEEAWRLLVEEAKDREGAGRASCPPIWGRDVDRHVLRLTRQNLERAVMDQVVRLDQADLHTAAPPSSDEQPGIFITNPPYGDRLGEDEEVLALHRDLGDLLRRRFLGWDAWVLCGRKNLMQALGLKPSRKHVVHNGPLECRFVHLPISSTAPTGRPGWRNQEKDA